MLKVWRLLPLQTDQHFVHFTFNSLSFRSNRMFSIFFAAAMRCKILFDRKRWRDEVKMKHQKMRENKNERAKKTLPARKIMKFFLRRKTSFGDEKFTEEIEFKIVLLKWKNQGSYNILRSALWQFLVESFLRKYLKINSIKTKKELCT